MSKVLSCTYCQKWCHLTLKYLVLEVTLQFFATVYAPLLSSYIKLLLSIIDLNSSVQLVVDTSVLINVMIGRIILVADDKAEYSASMVDNDTSVCRNDFQINGHGPKKMMYPVRDFADVDSVSGSIL